MAHCGNIGPCPPPAAIMVTPLPPPKKKLNPRTATDAAGEKHATRWLKSNRTQGNAVHQPSIYGLKHSPTSDCYINRKKHMTTDRGPNLYSFRMCTFAFQPLMPLNKRTHQHSTNVDISFSDMSNQSTIFLHIICIYHP